MAQAITFLSGGFATSASTLSFANLHFILRFSRVWGQRSYRCSANTTVIWHMKAFRICRTWTALYQARKEDRLNNNVRLITLSLTRWIRKLLAASLCHNDVWNKECVILLLFVVCKCILYYCHRVTTQLQLRNILRHIPQLVNSKFPRKGWGPKHKIYKWDIGNILCGYDTRKEAVDCDYCKV